MLERCKIQYNTSDFARKVEEEKPTKNEKIDPKKIQCLKPLILKTGEVQKSEGIDSNNLDVFVEDDANGRRQCFHNCHAWK